MHDTALALPLVAAIFALAGTVKGIAGLGLPTVSIGLLGLWMSPMQAAALLLVPALVTNVQQMLDGPALRELLRRLWPMLVGILVGAAGAASFAGTIDPRLSTGLLGATLASYGLLGLAGVELPPPGRLERWLGAPIGVATGVLTAATGVYVVPAVPWLQSLRLPPDRMVQALGLSFTASSIGLGTALLQSGGLSARTALDGGVALVAAMAGMALGTRLRRRLSPAAFRRGFFVATLALGAQLAWKAWSASPA
jgi:uncharacterized membrane protein YfcA